MRSDKSQLHSEKGLILAADVPDIASLNSLLHITSGFPEVVAIKIGFTLGLRYGLPAVVKAIQEIHPVPVIYDHQKAGTDIPQMGKPFASVCQSAGITAVIFFPQAGPKSLEGFVNGALEMQLIPIVGLIMTHDAYLKSEGGYITDEAPDLIVKSAIKLGVKDFVLPGTKPEIVKRFADGQLSPVPSYSIMMPGIGSQGGSLSTAFRAALPHRRFAIVGSAIYAAKDPKQALISFVEQIRDE